MKYIISIFTLIFFATVAYNAHAQSYTFSKSNTPYTDLANPDMVVPDTSPYFGNVIFSVPANFSVFGKSYNLNDGIFVNMLKGGFFISNATRSSSILATGINLSARKGNNGHAVFSYKFDTGNGLTIMEWKNFNFDAGDTADYISFQVRLYPQSGKVEIHYGNGNAKPGAFGAGKNGLFVEMEETNNVFTTVFNRVALKNNPSNPDVDNDTQTLPGLSGIPSAGTLYTFTPTPLTVSPVSDGATPVVFPSLLNASTRELKLACDAQDIKMVSLTDAFGRSFTCELKGNRVELPQMAPGIYYLGIYLHNGQHITAKILEN